MKNLDIREFISGFILIGLGLFVALYASANYDAGSVRSMGPGFFPILLGWVLAGLGVIVALTSLRSAVHELTPPQFQPRALLAVLGAVFAFSVLIGFVGLVPTTVVMVVIAATANRKFRIGPALILGLCLSLLVWLIFTIGLGMNLPAFEFPR